LHGLFADDSQRAGWIRRLGGAPGGISYTEDVETVLDALAAHLETHVDVGRLLSLAR
jgi:adenosylcobyric acid synthase